MEVKSGSRRKFWEGATKKIIIVIFFLFYYFEIGRLAFQSGTNSRRTTFSGGVGVHILKFIWQKILPEKNPLADNLKFSRALRITFINVRSESSKVL